MARFARMAVVIAALVSLGAAACGGGSAPGTGGTLRSALASVRDVAASEAFFAWADSTELRKLTGVERATDIAKSAAQQRWARLAEVALPAIAGKEPQFAAATGIDPSRGTRSITIGVPPDRASRLDGVDSGTVLRLFRLLGAREQRVAGRTYLAVADEGQVNVSNPRLGDDVYLTINRVFTSGSTVAFGLSDPPIAAVLGGGKTLADVPAESAVADCLGDVFVAEIIAAPTQSPGGASLIGLGVRRPAASDAPVTEVLCEATKTKGQAASLAGAIGSRVAPGAGLPGSTLQVRDRVAQAGVDQVAKGGQPLVRLTLDLVGPARAGFLFFDEGPDALAVLAGRGGVGTQAVPSP